MISSWRFDSHKNLKKLLHGRPHQIIADDFFEIEDAIPFKATEANKNLEQVQKLAEQIELGRDGTLVAIGGGITLDFVGFLAAIHNRGIAWIAVPTTLLAMTDTCIGGKTGVNLLNHKNQLGRIHTPREVLIDIDLLNTLSKDQFASGMAEVIKHALIADKTFFEFLEKNSQEILNKNPEILKKMLEQSISIKEKIVKEDYFEQGIRKLLNFGHTFGHALERASNFEIPHGHAVALGIIEMNKLSNAPEQERIIKLLKSFNLPTELPQNYNLREHAKLDKKRNQSGIDLIQLEEIGKAKIVHEKSFFV